MNWKSLLFSFRGRINRGKWWLALLFTLIIWAILFALIFISNVAHLGSVPGLLISAVFLITTIWSGLAVTIKRLHDHNKSGWWLLFFYGALALLDPVATAMGDSVGALIVRLTALAMSIGAMVVLGGLRGTRGPNRFGPDPLSDTTSEIQIPA